MEYLNNKSAHDILMNTNEEDLLGRVIAYVIASAPNKEKRLTEPCALYRLHLDCSNNWKLIIPAAEKQLPENSTIFALLWTTPKKKKRLYVLGDDAPIKDQDEIVERWKTEYQRVEAEQSRAHQVDDSASAFGAN
jgi:hypothetical protein